jgi:proteasome activator subunit 4
VSFSLYLQYSIDNWSALSNFVEQSQSVYDLEIEPLHRAAEELFKILPENIQDRDMIQRNSRVCKERLEATRNYLDEAHKALLAIGTSDKTHWRYSIVALRMLRALVRREVPNTSPQMEYFLSKTTDNHPSIRYVGTMNSLLEICLYIFINSTLRGQL